MKNLIIILILILGVNAVTFAQTKTVTKKEATQTIYSCSHHANVVSNKAGNCAKCGMKLVARTVVKHNPAVKGSQMTVKKEKVYICTMCKGVTAKKKGNCPKCGMVMIEKKRKK